MPRAKTNQKRPRHKVTAKAEASQLGVSESHVYYLRRQEWHPGPDATMSQRVNAWRIHAALSADDDEILKRRRLAEALLAESKAKLAQMEVDESEGRLVDADTTKSQLTRLLTRVRNRLMNVPAEVQGEIAALVPDESAEIAQIIRERIRSATEDLVASERAKKEKSGKDDRT